MVCFKVLPMWYSASFFSFIRPTFLEKKPDKWRQIYKQARGTFYTSKDMCFQYNVLRSKYY